MPIAQKKKPTPERVVRLEPNQIFVFGSNTEGRHGAGAAAMAKQRFGAVQGVAQGMQGQSYAIATKDLGKGRRSVPLREIKLQIGKMLLVAKCRPDLEFLVTKLGTGLAGYTIEEIAGLFVGEDVPDNVRLPRGLEVCLERRYLQQRRSMVKAEIADGLGGVFDVTSR